VANEDWRASRTEDPERARRFVAATQRMLDLPRLCTGPTPTAGIGPDYPKHQAQELTLGVLVRLPGEGWALVEAGLRSPSVRVRRAALKVLAEWPQWPAEAAGALRLAHAREPDETLQAEMAELLPRAV
jgi:hypothetical protein